MRKNLKKINPLQEKSRYDRILGKWQTEEKKSQPKEEKQNKKGCPWLIKDNYWLARVFARYLGIQGTQFGGIGRHKAQKVEKNHNLKKRNPKYRDAPWLIKANNWVARFNREQRGNWKVGTHERRWRAPLESPDAPAIALRNALPTSKVPLAKITRFK